MTALAFYKLLADPTRLQSILIIMDQQELCVCELSCALTLSQPKISRHLAMLRQAQLLADRRQGAWVYYRLDPNLPDWIKQCLQLTLMEQQAELARLRQALNQMGNRPQRLLTCCADTTNEPTTKASKQ